MDRHLLGLQIMAMISFFLVGRHSLGLLIMAMISFFCIFQALTGAADNGDGFRPPHPSNFPRRGLEHRFSAHHFSVTYSARTSEGGKSVNRDLIVSKETY